MFLRDYFLVISFLRDYFRLLADAVDLGYIRDCTSPATPRWCHTTSPENNLEETRSPENLFIHVPNGAPYYTVPTSEKWVWVWGLLRDSPSPQPPSHLPSLDGQSSKGRLVESYVSRSWRCFLYTYIPWKELDCVAYLHATHPHPQTHTPGPFKVKTARPICQMHGKGQLHEINCNHWLGELPHRWLTL